MSLICIVHEDHHEEYPKIKEISAQNEARIQEAKRLHINGTNKDRKEQCTRIPNIIDQTKHGIHPNCYKNFTRIIAKSRPVPTTPTNSAAKRSSRRILSPPSSNSSTCLFPKECCFCGSVRKKHNDKIVSPVTITTYNAANTIKNYAKEKDPSWYAEIYDLDLIAKELQYHIEPCYKNKTRTFSSKSSNTLAVDTAECSDAVFIEMIDSSTNFAAVKEMIIRDVIEMDKVVSMKILHHVYGGNVDDKRYRGKLKTMIMKEFPKEILFVQCSNNTAEVVINAEAPWKSGFDSVDRIAHIKRAAQYLNDEIVQYARNLPETSWPPTAEELLSEDRSPPEALLVFLKYLLKEKDHGVMRHDVIPRLINSFAADIIHGVTRGKVLTAKHLSLALGLHNLTGSKRVIEINSKLGHCIDYNLVCDIETAQAQQAQILAEKSTILPLKPKGLNDVVNSWFWCDNHDEKVEAVSGSGSVNITTTMAFQEECENSVRVTENNSIPRTKSRVLDIHDNNIKVPNIDPKRNPPKIPTTYIDTQDVENSLNSRYLIWLMLRKQNGKNRYGGTNDQVVANFAGWLLKHRSVTELKKTVETYLPPITTKVTEFGTIVKYMDYFQRLAQDVNMPYVNITLDIGAAINAFKMIWNYPERFSNIIIHPGDFHFMKENFLVIGMIVSSSGFEDAVFQSQLCSSGSLMGVIAGSHYNRAWMVHSTVSEAMERLLLQRFLHETRFQLPSELEEICIDTESYSESILSVCEEFIAEYESFKESIRKGVLGYTAQYWMMYLDLMRQQHAIHISVQENNFKLRLNAWQYFVPFYFALGKTNYARYGSFYVHQMKSIDIIFPGLKKFLQKNGMSVQAQEKYALRTAVDQRGEQTINKDAKTTGGIKGFAPNSNSVLKWTLNKAAKAANTKVLYDICGIGTESEKYKSCRPSQILRSEERVSKVIDVLSDEYINPFSPEIDKSKLLNLSSGVAVPENITEEILALPVRGVQLADEFQKTRLSSTSVPFHEKIKRNVNKTFMSTKIQITLKKGQSKKTVDANRTILASLVHYAIQSGKRVDYEEVLKYPLSPVPLSMSHENGSRRSCKKSDLIDIILTSRGPDNRPVLSNSSSAYILDLVALFHSVTEIPDTYEQLIWKLLKMIPTNYHRVDIVADSYRENSIKSSERNSRGNTVKVMIKSEKSKVPRDFKEFLRNGENKTTFIKMMFQLIIENKDRVLLLLKTNTIYLSSENFCKVLTNSAGDDVDELKSDQEEADTRVILHSLHALTSDNGLLVKLRSPSADTDILVLAVTLLSEFKERVYFDSGVGDKRRLIWLGGIDIPEQHMKALIGFHAFTGNDYVASFFRRGKRKCWKVMTAYNKFQECFANLGESWIPSESIFTVLEEYVCYLYSHRNKSVNSVRYKMFEKKLSRENKSIDLASIPPCKSVLNLHIKRANIVAKIWKNSGIQEIEIPNDSGWDSDGNIIWIEEAFPSSIEDVLFDEAYDKDGYEQYEDVESDDEAEL